MPLPPVRALPILSPPKRLTSAVISAKPHQRSDLLPSLCFGGVTEGATKKLRSNIRRSTETGVAVEMRSRVPRQGSRESTDGSTNSNSSDGTCVQPTPTVSPPSTWVLWSLAQGWKIWLGLQARYLSPSVLLPPSVPFPWTPAAWAPVSLFLLAAFPHQNTPVAQEQPIPLVCFMPPTSQGLHALPLQRRELERKMGS